MYNIEPLTVWINGENKIVTKIECTIVEDNLQDGLSGYAKFLYKLGEPLPVEQTEQISINWLIQGNVSMSGQNYADWDNSNAAAYQYVATEINVILI
jgi:hypothetical protein